MMSMLLFAKVPPIIAVPVGLATDGIILFVFLKAMA